MAGRLQNEDFKTLSELTGAGGSTNQLLNDTKIYITNAALASQLSSLITSGDVLTSASLLKLGITTDSTTTGTAAAMPAATKGILRLTNASLVSISTITGQAAGQYFVLINRTGNSFTINDNDAANGIRTGTGSAMTVTNNASVVIAYDSTSARSQVIGGSGSSISTPVSIANGGTGQTTKAAAFDALSPMTTAGDLIYGGASGTGTRLATGVINQILSNTGSAPSWKNNPVPRKNYLGTVNNINGNGDVELGATTSWSLAHSSLTNGFPSTVASATNTFSSAGGLHGGSAASGNLALTTVSSDVLSGSYSLSYASSAATTAGDMLIHDGFLIEQEDQAKALSFSFSYKAKTNASNGTFSGTSTNSFAIAFYDVANAVWIQPSSTWGIVQSSGVGVVSGQFQTASNGTSYQIAVYNMNATAGAITMYFDSFRCGPLVLSTISPIIDWQSYTPTFNGSPTVSSVTFWYRRVGDSVQINGAFQLTSVNASTTALTMPSGLSIDTAKVGSTRKFVFGEASRIIQTASEASLVKHVVGYNTSFTNQLFIASTSLSQTLGQNAWNGLFVNNDWVTIDALVPIAGWSSGIVMADQTDTRQVEAIVTTTANITGTAGSAFVFPTVTKDTHGAYNSSTGVYTVFVPGDYEVAAWGLYNNVGDINLNVQVNSSFVNNLTTTDTSRPKSGVLKLANLKANDTIKLVPDTSRNLLYSAGNYIPSMSITRLPSSTTIAQTDEVSAYGTAGSGQSISNSTSTVLTLVSSFDTHGMVVSNIVTIPAPGRYFYQTTVQYAGNTSGVRQMWCERSTDGGTNWTTVTLDTIPAAATSGTKVTTEKIFNCNAGDKFRFQTWQNSGVALTITSAIEQQRFNFFRLK